MNRRGVGGRADFRHLIDSESTPRRPMEVFCLPGFVLEGQSGNHFRKRQSKHSRRAEERRAILREGGRDRGRPRPGRRLRSELD